MSTYVPTSPNVLGNSRLTIKLPASAEKENYKPEAAKSDSADVMTDEKQRRTFCAAEYQQTIINMIERHYCAHPLIPGYSHPSPEGIRAWAVKQTYGYCIERDL
jgi:hypothetical protein